MKTIIHRTFNYLSYKLIRVNLSTKPIKLQSMIYEFISISLNFMIFLTAKKFVLL
jgi:hypothetical protein